MYFEIYVLRHTTKQNVPFKNKIVSTCFSSLGIMIPYKDYPENHLNVFRRNLIEQFQKTSFYKLEIPVLLFVDRSGDQNILSS